jgi:putative Holliday junction resolvase
MPVIHRSVLALDVGAKRVGVAVASLQAQLPRPLITLDRESDTLFPTLQNIAEVEGVIALVVGFPRGLQGQRTAQTQAIEDFAQELRQHFALPLHFQDEALTSKHARAELDARGRPYDRSEIDSLAATYILEDFLRDQQQIKRADS